MLLLLPLLLPPLSRLLQGEVANIIAQLSAAASSMAFT
jgi:hypothetical protein